MDYISNPIPLFQKKKRFLYLGVWIRDALKVFGIEISTVSRTTAQSVQFILKKTLRTIIYVSLCPSCVIFELFRASLD